MNSAPLSPLSSQLNWATTTSRSKTYPLRSPFSSSTGSASSGLTSADWGANHKNPPSSSASGRAGQSKAPFATTRGSPQGNGTGTALRFSNPPHLSGNIELRQESWRQMENSKPCGLPTELLRPHRERALQQSPCQAHRPRPPGAGCPVDTNPGSLGHSAVVTTRRSGTRRTRRRAKPSPSPSGPRALEWRAARSASSQKGSPPTMNRLGIQAEILVGHPTRAPARTDTGQQTFAPSADCQ